MNAMMSIKDVCAESELSMVYVRRMIQKGVLKTTKVTLDSGKGFKHMIRREDFLQWRETSSHNRRTDGRGRYVLYGTSDEITKLTEMVKESGLGVIITRQNQVKNVETEDSEDSE